MKHVAMAAVLTPMLAIAIPTAMASTPDTLGHPASNHASGTVGAAAHSVIAPRLPTPDVPEGASPGAFLQAARKAVSDGKTGLAEEALERAQTRALDNTQIGPEPASPMSSEMATRIGDARTKLNSGDRQAALAAIDNALLLTPTKTSSNDKPNIPLGH